MEKLHSQVTTSLDFHLIQATMYEEEKLEFSKDMKKIVRWPFSLRALNDQHAYFKTWVST